MGCFGTFWGGPGCDMDSCSRNDECSAICNGATNGAAAIEYEVYVNSRLCLGSQFPHCDKHKSCSDGELCKQLKYKEVRRAVVIEEEG